MAPSMSQLQQPSTFDEQRDTTSTIVKQPFTFLQGLEDQPLDSNFTNHTEQQSDLFNNFIMNDPETLLQIRPCKNLNSRIKKIREKKVFSFFSNLPKKYDEAYQGYTVAVVQWVRLPRSARDFTLVRLLELSQASIFKVSPVIYAFIYSSKTSPPLPLTLFQLILIENPLLLRSAKTTPIPLAISIKWRQVYLLGQCIDLKPCAFETCYQLVKASSNPRCEFHLLEDLKRAKNNRMEFSSTSAPIQLTDAFSKNGSMKLAELEQKSGGLVYWIGSHIISPFESKVLLKTHPRRKALIHDAMQQCHSVGAQYLRKLHSMNDLDFDLDEKSKRKEEKRKQELKKGIDSVLEARFVNHHFSTSNGPQRKRQKIQFHSPSLKALKNSQDLSDSDGLEILSV